MKKSKISSPGTSIVQILHTKDYSIFKRINSNRDVNKSHLRMLKRSIESKNLLHLFPVVVNSDMEIIDGQHRLTAAMALGLTAYYIKDDSVNKADIAMVNCNRKGWGIRDFISFHAEEGKVEYKRLGGLLKKYPKITVMGCVRLMDGKNMNFATGGNMTAKLRSGDIDDSNYALAQVICDLAEKLKENGMWYSFNSYFLMDIKNAIIQSGMLAQQAADTIFSKQAMLPKDVDSSVIFLLSMLKDILGIKTQRPYSSAREVSAFLENQATRVKL